MTLSLELALKLEKKAHLMRKDCVQTVFNAGSGHLGGALSVMDLLVLLYYHVMNIDKENPNWEDRDRFIMSKGHAGIGLVSILADIGYIDHEDLKTFNLTGSQLGMHLDSNKVRGVDASTGSLGHGLSMAMGMALAGRQKKQDYKVFCVLGDGECNEGSVWEAAMAINQFKPTSLVTFIDRNHAMIDGNTEDVMGLEPFQDKWNSFGLKTVTVNGHNFFAMAQAIEDALESDVPCCIILDTVKGAGVDFAAGDYRWHYGAINEEMAQQAYDSLDAYHEQRVAAMKGE